MSTNEIKRVEITCDLCKKSINPDLPYVAAGTYGADFHIHCADVHKPILKALGLDEINLMRAYEEWSTSRKYIHT